MINRVFTSKRVKNDEFEYLDHNIRYFNDAFSNQFGNKSEINSDNFNEEDLRETGINFCVFPKITKIKPSPINKSVTMKEN